MKHSKAENFGVKESGVIWPDSGVIWRDAGLIWCDGGFDNRKIVF